MNRKLADKEKKKAKKRAARRRRLLFGGICIFGLGYLFGMHHRVFAAALKGEDASAAQKGKCVFGW